jgi:hypothetical protein
MNSAIGEDEVCAAVMTCVSVCVAFWNMRGIHLQNFEAECVHDNIGKQLMKQMKDIGFINGEISHQQMHEKYGGRIMKWFNYGIISNEIDENTAEEERASVIQKWFHCCDSPVADLPLVGVDEFQFLAIQKFVAQLKDTVIFMMKLDGTDDTIKNDVKDKVEMMIFKMTVEVKYEDTVIDYRPNIESMRKLIAEERGV